MLRYEPAVTLSHTQLGLGVLLTDTSTLGQVEPGIESPTFWFVDNLHEALIHCHLITCE